MNECITPGPPVVPFLKVQYLLIQNFDAEVSGNYQAVIDIMIIEKSGEEITQDRFGELKTLVDTLFTITTSPPEYELDLSQRPIIRMKITDLKTESTSTTLKLTMNDTLFEPGQDEIEIIQNQEVDPEEVSSVSNQSNLMGTVNNYGGTSTEVLSVLGSLGGLDSTGSLLKFSQMSKLFTRYRMINLNFGFLLDTHFKTSALKYDKASEESFNWMLTHTDGNYAKFSENLTPIEPFEFMFPKIIIFLISSVFKFLSHWLMKEAKLVGKISKSVCYFVHFQ